MPTDTAATDATSGSPRSAPRPRSQLDGVGQRDVRAGDRRRPGAAVGLEHVAVDHDRVLAERAHVDSGPQRPADQPGDLVRTAADAPAHRLPVRAGVGRTRQHRVLRGDPAQAAAASPARDPLGHAGRDEHAGLPELDQHRALGVLEPAAGERHRPQLVRSHGHQIGSWRARLPTDARRSRSIRPRTTRRGGPTSTGPANAVRAAAARPPRGRATAARASRRAARRRPGWPARRPRRPVWWRPGGLSGPSTYAASTSARSAPARPRPDPGTARSRRRRPACDRRARSGTRRPRPGDRPGGR